jgi:GT2 family glycosyltransferase
MITIVIVNWNSGSLLVDCLSSIAEFGGTEVEKVIVVDNGSTDGSLVGVDALGVRPLEVIRNLENQGFARACNAGARAASSEFLLFLNPDARLMRDTLVNARRAMTEHNPTGVAIVGAQLIDESGSIARSCAKFPSPLRFVLHALGVDRVLPGLGCAMTTWDHSYSREVDHVIGAFYLIRTSVFHQLVGFDEAFFVYLEDLDMSLRASQRGWRSWFESSAVAFHMGGGASRQAKPQRLFYSLRSRILYARKHFGALGYSAVIVTTLALEPCTRLLAAAIQRDRAVAAETLGGYRLLWRWFFDRQHPKPSTLRSPAHSSSDLLG